MRIEVVQRLEDVAAEQWDALVDANDPFAEHAFLSALERTGCVGLQPGWIPCHVLAYDGQRLVGAVPLYLKDNSYGEYIFDWGWAEAAYAGGVPYYPKLVAAVPFTPVSGRRLLTGSELDEDVVRALVTGVQAIADEAKVSSVHWLFLSEAEQRLLCDNHGYMARLTHQYHWSNADYRDFDAFLSEFRAPARKNVRRERRKAHECGLVLSSMPGDQLDERDWNALFRFYRDTGARKWGRPYLNRAFFERLRVSFAHRVLATVARKPDDGEPVAGALFFHKGQHLLGRYWGCLEQHDALHFELCYYQPIELCIERGWQRFEAGAQGPHKIKRGLMPALTYSAHWIRDRGLARGIGRYLQREAAALRHELPLIAQTGPFKREP